MKAESLIRVAYAEDHATMRISIISFLHQLGGIAFDIQAANGRELIKQLEEAKSLPDVCMLDINMPEMDGFETMQIIKSRWPQLKTLILSTFENELYILRMIMLGTNGYLLKNCNPAEIKKALLAIHDENLYFREANIRQLYSRVKNGTAHLPHFSNHEAEFLKYCPTDLGYTEIARRMNTTVKAIDGYRDRLCEKLAVKGRVGLAICAIQFGFVHMESRTRPLTFVTAPKRNAR